MNRYKSGQTNQLSDHMSVVLLLEPLGWVRIKLAVVFLTLQGPGETLGRLGELSKYSTTIKMILCWPSWVLQRSDYFLSWPTMSWVRAGQAQQIILHTSYFNALRFKNSYMHFYCKLRILPFLLVKILLLRCKETLMVCDFSNFSRNIARCVAAWV